MVSFNREVSDALSLDATYRLNLPAQHMQKHVIIMGYSHFRDFLMLNW